MESVLLVLFGLVGFYVLYWVVRLGVRDGIADADERRNRGDSEEP